MTLLRYARFPLTLNHVSSTRQDREGLPGRRCRRRRLSIIGAQACTRRQMVAWSTETPRSSSISSRSRQLTPYRPSHRAARRMVSPRNCRHVKSWVMGGSPNARMSGRHAGRVTFSVSTWRMRASKDQSRPLGQGWTRARQLRLKVAVHAAREAGRMRQAVWGKAQRLHGCAPCSRLARPPSSEEHEARAS